MHDIRHGSITYHPGGIVIEDIANLATWCEIYPPVDSQCVCDVYNN